MITSIKSRLLTAALILSSLSLVSAQTPPSGSLSFSFDPAEYPPVFDLTGTYDFNQTLWGANSFAIPVEFALNDVTMDRTGHLKFTDAAATVVTIGSEAAAATTKMSGTVSRSGNVTKAVLSVKMSGNDTVFGKNNTRFSISLTYNLEVTTSGLTGTVKGSASFSGLGSGKINDTISLDLPANCTGAWTDNMNLLALKKLGGSGTIVLSNGRSLPVNISGSYSYNVKKSPFGTAKLTQTGYGTDSSGSSLSLTLVNNTNAANGFDVIALKGKILGQSIKQ
jgi:hypothetical protein